MAADANEEFEFTVTLDDTSINGTYGAGDSAMTFTNGVAKFKLKGGEKAVQGDGFRGSLHGGHLIPKRRRSPAPRSPRSRRPPGWAGR